MSTNQPSIGCIGLGMMGKPIALNLINAGYTINFYARRAATAAPLLDAGAKQFQSPKQLAENCNVIITNVSNTNDVETVVLGEDGIIESARPGTIVMDMSTISPAVTKKIALQLQQKKIHMLDAPVSGGPQGAEQGTLSIMVGGDENIFQQMLPLLQIVGKNIVYMGDHGAGQTTKACNQIVVVQTLVAVGEALLFAKAAGVDPQKVRQALLGGYAFSPILETHGLRMLQHKFVPGFKSKLHHKDMHIVQDTAQELNIQFPVTELVTQYLDELMLEQKGELDSSAILLILEKITGVSLR